MNLWDDQSRRINNKRIVSFVLAYRVRSYTGVETQECHETIRYPTIWSIQGPNYKATVSEQVSVT